ncbi:helix-hairpin-helix domain-containing protein [Gottfriedia luciferensis]|uniref:DNA-binding protein n=1 Tax=Gottfriedia luciferensis TaxID=178774 RepID=UPI002E256EF9
MIVISEKDSSLPTGLSKPAIRALTSAGYLHLEQFTKLTETELSKLHGMGPKGIKTIRQALEEKGLSFKS